MKCPKCGSEDFTTWSYDHGEDSETGYRNAGVRAKCQKCGHEADVEDFQCDECGHRISVHGKDGCEAERGDAWVDGVSMGGWVAQGPCGCQAVTLEEECDGDQKTNESGATEKATDAQASQSHTPEESSGGTEVFFGHCPGCAAADR